jgi:hypothetical protein
MRHVDLVVVVAALSVWELFLILYLSFYEFTKIYIPLNLTAVSKGGRDQYVCTKM